MSDWDSLAKQNSSQPVRLGLLHTITGVLMEAIKKGNAINQEQDGRINALEARVTSLEARPMPKYAGTYQTGKSYAANSLVTKGGSLWFALESTAGTPGNDSNWRLIVKRGSV